jgi:hypothetical protein
MPVTWKRREWENDAIFFNDLCVTEKAKEIPKHGRATELTL